MGHVSPFKTSMFQEIFDDIRISSIQMGFDPWNCSLKIQKSIKTPTPNVGGHLKVWGFIPSYFHTLPRPWDLTPGLPSWPTPLQTLALIANPRLGLRQDLCSWIQFHSGGIFFIWMTLSITFGGWELCYFKLLNASCAWKLRCAFNKVQFSSIVVNNCE
jgi:hypothetical protein